MVNILGLDAAVMIWEGKIAEDGGTAELLCSSISYTAYVILNTVNRAGEKKWRVEGQKQREERGLSSFLYTVEFTLGKNILQSQQDRPERKSSVGDN